MGDPRDQERFQALVERSLDPIALVSPDGSPSPSSSNC
jgi:hypothetical protein